MINTSPNAKRFEVKRTMIDGKLKKAIHIDGEIFDWDVDRKSLIQAMQMGPEYFEVVKNDIQKHFLDSLSDFIHRQVTAEEVETAKTTGWI